MSILFKLLNIKSNFKHITFDDYIAKYGNNSTSVIPSYDTNWKRLLSFNEKFKGFDGLLCNKWPEMKVIEVDKPLINDIGWVFSRNYFLSETSWSRHSQNLVQKKIYKTIKKKGVVFSLNSEWASNNYGHLLLDCLPRINLFRKAGYDFESVDYIYCPQLKNNKFKELLYQCGVPRDKCIWGEKGVIFKFDRAIITTFPGFKMNYPEWSVDFLKNVFCLERGNNGRRLYVSRGLGAKRTIFNENRLLEVLRGFDFEIYVPHLNSCPQKDFSEASVIVGAHGAGLSDIAFCSAGTRVLEMIPSDHVYPHFYSLSNAAKCDYGVLLGESMHHRPLGSFGPSPYDFTVEEDLFLEGIKWCCSY